jgi:hypothetical protein
MNKRLRRLPDSFQNSETAQRQAEIARLNADLDSPTVPAARPQVDGGRSTAPGDPAESEVKDAASAEAATAERAETDRA